MTTSNPKPVDRWCAECKAPIPLGTSEIYDPAAVNPNPPPFYLELCSKCAEKRQRKKKTKESEEPPLFAVLTVAPPAWEPHMIVAGYPDEEISSPIKQNEAGKESTIHVFNGVSDCHFHFDPKAGKAALVGLPKGVQGKVRIVARHIFPNRPEILLAEFTVDEEGDHQTLGAGRWLKQHTIHPGEVLVTTLLADVPVDPKVITLCLDVGVEETHSDGKPNGPIQEFVVLPEVPNLAVSRKLMPNHPGVFTHIHSWKMPPGIAGWVPTDPAHGLQFIPRDAEGNVVCGTVQLLIQSRLRHHTRRILQHRGAVEQDWTYTQIPCIEKVLVESGQVIVTEFLADKVIDPAKTFFQIKMETWMPHRRGLSDESTPFVLAEGAKEDDE